MKLHETAETNAYLLVLAALRELENVVERVARQLGAHVASPAIPVASVPEPDISLLVHSVVGAGGLKSWQMNDRTVVPNGR